MLLNAEETDLKSAFLLVVINHPEDPDNLRIAQHSAFNRNYVKPVLSLILSSRLTSPFLKKDLINCLRALGTVGFEATLNSCQETRACR